MNAVAEILPATDIMLAVEETPQIVLLDAEKFDQFYERVKAETDGLVVDLSTKKGRDEVRSMAARVVRSKTMIDKAGLALTKQWRDQTNQVNAARKEIEARLEALADEVRRPLTEWEDAEKARVNACREIIDGIKQSGIVTLDDTAADVRARGKMVWDTPINPDQFGDMAAEAQAAKDTAVEALKSALARLTREEEERAELEKLRAEKEERDRIEAERVAREQAEREEREAKERAEAEAREAEERRIAAEKADQERIAQAARDAEDRARRDAEEAAQAERERVQREHEEALAAERRRAEEAEAAAQTERDRIAREEADRAAEAKRVADQKAADEANKALQRRLKTEAKEAIMSCGVSEEAAQKIVLAVRAKEIPHIEWIV